MFKKLLIGGVAVGLLYFVVLPLLFTLPIISINILIGIGLLLFVWKMHNKEVDN